MIGIDLNDPEVALPAQAEIRVLDAFVHHDRALIDREPAEGALELCTAVLLPGGGFVAKIFQGAEFEDARDAVRARFGKVRIIRPEATRNESYELFLVGLGFRPVSS